MTSDQVKKNLKYLVLLVIIIVNLLILYQMLNASFIVKEYFISQLEKRKFISITNSPEFVMDLIEADVSDSSYINWQMHYKVNQLGDTVARDSIYDKLNTQYIKNAEFQFPTIVNIMGEKDIIDFKRSINNSGDDTDFYTVSELVRYKMSHDQWEDVVDNYTDYLTKNYHYSLVKSEKTSVEQHYSEIQEMAKNIKIDDTMYTLSIYVVYAKINGEDVMTIQYLVRY